MKRLLQVVLSGTLLFLPLTGWLHAEDASTEEIPAAETQYPEVSQSFNGSSPTSLQMFHLLVEPLSTEWETRLVPPLLESLLHLAPFSTLRVEPEISLLAVAQAPGRLALLHRSSALDQGAGALGLELLEVGPASCLVLAVREEAQWRSYSDLNYGLDQPLRVEAVSPAARRHFERVHASYPLATQFSLAVRPTHVAVQRLVAKESDLLVLDAPRRGVSGEPADVMTFLQKQNLRLLPVPMDIFKHHERLNPGGVVIASTWFWQDPATYATLCDPFVLAMPMEGADQLIYAMYNAISGNGKMHTPPDGPNNDSNNEGFFARIAAAVHSLLVMLGLRQ